MAKNSLDCFNRTLVNDDVIYSILPKVLTLKHCKDEVVNFMNRAAEVCEETNDSLRTACTLAFNIAKQEERFPELEFELHKQDGSSVIIGSSGFLINKTNTRTELPSLLQDFPEEDARIEGLEELVFNGINNISFRGWGEAYRSLNKDNLNKTCSHNFIQADDRMRHWNIERLFQFYIDFGNKSWLSPVTDFMRLDKKKNIHRYRHIIVDKMVDYGKLGFCPTQFLRRIIVPLLDRGIEPDDLEQRLNNIFRAVTNVNRVLNQTGGDGSASNIFTMKYFIRSIAVPSRLYQESYYDKDSGLTLDGVFLSLARRWGWAFTQERDMQSLKFEMMRAYLDQFVQSLVRVESPNEIINGFSRLYTHIRDVCRNLRDRDVHFNAIVHRNFFRKLEEQETRDIDTLQWMYKHLDVVEKLSEAESKTGKGQFGYRYHRYLILLGNGVFKEPDDIDAYFNLHELLREESINTPEADEFIANFLQDAKSPDSRALLVEFMTSCPVLDGEIYQRWKKLKPNERESLINEVNAFMHNYLYDPKDLSFKSKFGIDYYKIEDSVIVRLVRTSRASKEEIRKQLKKNRDKKIPKITEDFDSKYFQVRQRIDNKDYKLDNKNIEFLRRKVSVTKHIVENAEGNRYRALCLETLLQRLSQYHRELVENLQTKKDERAIAGIKSSLEAPLAFIEFLRDYTKTRLSDPVLKRQILELAFTILGYDKGFHKENADLYARLVLFSQWNEQDPLNLMQRPYTDIINLRGQEERYNLNQLNSLYQIFAVNSQHYFIKLFRELEGKIPINLANAINNLLKETGLDHLVDANAATRSDFFYNIFKKYQSIRQIEDETKALKKRLDKVTGTTKLELALVPGKTKMDQFYGDVGENCTSGYPDEILRKDFIPVRVINTESSALEGYIYLLNLKHEDKKLLMIAGIEPKQSLLSGIDEVDFYLQVRNCIIDWAKKGGYSMVVYPVNKTAHSNRDSIFRIITADVEDKPLSEIGNVWFPRNIYNMNGGILVWSDGSLDIPLTTNRYSMAIANRLLFVS